MLTEENVEDLLEKAQQAENICDWTTALIFYNQAAELFQSKNMVEEAAETYKKLGYVNLNAASTVDTEEQLIKSKNEIIKYFEKAKVLFNKSNNRIGILECEVGVLQINFYSAASLREVVNFSEKARDLLPQLIDFYYKKDDKENLAAALSYFALFSILIPPESNVNRKKIHQKGIESAKKSWKISKEIGNSKFLTESLQYELLLRSTQVQTQEFRWDTRWKEIFRELLSRSNETMIHVEKKDDSQSLMIAYSNYGSMNCFFGFHFIEDEKKQEEFTEKGLLYLEKALDIARTINDKYYILDLLSWIDWWALFGGKLDYLQKRLVADVSEMEELGKQFLGFYLFAGSINRILINYYSIVARWSIFTPAQRIEFAEKGIEYGESFLKMLISRRDPAINSSLTSLYSQLALLTSDTNKQGIYIEKMLENANSAYELGLEAEGGFLRSFGYLARYNAYKTLVDLAKNEKEKIEYLTIAIEAQKNHIEHTVESRTGIITARLRIGLLLEELGILSQNNDVLQKAEENFSKVINECIERGYKVYAANAYQYAARIDDRLANHLSSAKNYEKSREIHEDVLKKIEYKPLIKRIREKIQYSLAWNLIENAKVNHKGENHLKAKEFYLKASDILKEMVRYNFEATYYKAWALLEEAEHISKLEQQKQAIELYEKTIEAFEAAIINLEKASKEPKGEDELMRIDKLM
ncbi:MAG: hypothetical protein ACFE94_12580, partial [Candidatus Hodarchaeota archaeon]